MENLKQIIETIYPMGANLLGAGYDNALQYINHLIGLDIIEIPSGTELGTWKVPDEWIVKDAWIKFNGKKILDYKENPLSLMTYSAPFSGKMNLAELKNHLFISDDMPKATPYTYSFYEKNWGFNIPKQVALKEERGLWRRLLEACKECSEVNGEHIKVKIQGNQEEIKYKDALPEGEYEVFVDTEFRPGKMKIGTHTIKGKSNKEILLFAHLDHPYQANDNLSGAACLTDLYNKINCDHTVKIIFCPETIGSIGYALTQDISMVDFVLSVDICGNDHSLLVQKAFDRPNKLNRVAHASLQMIGESYRKGEFRNVIGSDEYVFNDPLINIPGLLLTRFPYKEYHTSEDTPDKINYEMIEKTQKVILKIIEIWEKDFIPKREVAGPLMRSRYGIQSPSKQLNLNYDYFWYAIDGKRSLSDLCAEFELAFDAMHEKLCLMEKDGFVSRVNYSQGRKQKASRKK